MPDLPPPNQPALTAAQLLEARKTNEHMSFDEWLAALDSAALTMGFKGRLVQDTGPDCWRCYFDEGYTPTEAITEDWSYD